MPCYVQAQPSTVLTSSHTREEEPKLSTSMAGTFCSARAGHNTRVTWRKWNSVMTIPIKLPGAHAAVTPSACSSSVVLSALSLPTLLEDDGRWDTPTKVTFLHIPNTWNIQEANQQLLPYLKERWSSEFSVLSPHSQSPRIYKKTILVFMFVSRTQKHR